MFVQVQNHKVMTQQIQDFLKGLKKDPLYISMRVDGDYFDFYSNGNLLLDKNSNPQIEDGFIKIEMDSIIDKELFAWGHAWVNIESYSIDEWNVDGSNSKPEEKEISIQEDQGYYI